MTRTARIIVDLALPEGATEDQWLIESVENLADIMAVQAEDGLFTGGSPDAEDSEFVLNWGSFSSGRSFTSSVTFVDLDDETSASRQHWIDTGRYLPKHCRYLPKHCRWCDDGSCHHLDNA